MAFANVSFDAAITITIIMIIIMIIITTTIIIIIINNCGVFLINP